MTSAAERFRRRIGAAPGPAAWLRAAVLALSAAALWWPFTLAAGVVAAAASAALGALVGDAYGRVPRSDVRLRASTVAGLALLVALVGLKLAQLGTDGRWLPALVGPVAALKIGQALLALLLTAPVVFVLRWLAVRHASFGALEVALVAAAFAASFAAHREGMVHRPLALGDLAWSRGIDPTLLFLVLGGACVLLLAALLVSERERRRIPLHLGALALVALLLVLFVRLSGLPAPRPSGDLGLTGEEAEGRAEASGAAESEGGGGREAAELRDLPFRDEYPSEGSQAPVAVVLLRDDYSPPSGVYYFRQSVFSQYNGHRLVQPVRDDVDLDVIARFPTRPLEVPGAPPASSQRKSLSTTTGLLVDHVRPFALDSPVEIAPRPNPDGMRFQRTFDAVSRVQTRAYEDMIGLAPGDPGWTASQWEHYTEAPSDPRYRETALAATSVLQPEYAGDPLAQALTVKAYLDHNGIYSRRSQHADAEDPTASFLFGDLTGYCVHFAHAAVYMLRSLGVPARVAAGYAVPESDRAGGSAIMIRGLNAHAWPEVYLEGVGWVVVDLYPERSLDELAPRTDENLQSMLGELLRRDGRREDPAAPQPLQLPTLAELGRALLAAVALAVAAGFGVKLYRSAVPTFATAPALPRVSYRAALDLLAAAGMSRRFGETRERFADRAIALAPSFGTLTGVHLRAALGGRGGADPAALRRLPADVRRELRARVPRWRRWLGVFDPFTWLRAR